MNLLEQISKSLQKAIEEKDKELIDVLSKAYQRLSPPVSTKEPEKKIGAYSN